MEKRNIVISGANGGMGRAIIERLKNENYRIFALDLSNDNINNYQNVEFIKCDLLDKESRDNAINTIKQKTNNLYGIINLAGIFLMESIIEGSESDLEKIIGINFFGTYYLNRGLFSILDKKSKIINMSSEVARFSPQPFMAYYTITKKMIDCYSDVLRRECNYLGIKVIKIQSGSMATNMLNKASNEYDILINNTQYFKSPLTKLKYMMDKELKNTNNPKIIANKIYKILEKKNPKIRYKVRNGFSLIFMNILPERLQDFIYKKVIK